MRCDLDQGGKMYEAPPQLPSVPEIVGIHFYTIDVNVAEKHIVRKLHLLEKISMEQALTEHFLPWMATAQEYSSIPAKEALVKWIFDNSKSPSVSWMTNVISQPIVPLPTRGGERHYRCLVDLVDPTSTFSKLYFDDERVFPCADFLKLHGVALMACRLSKGVTSMTPLDRARYYSSCGGTLLELQEKVQLLLKVTVQFGFTSSAASINEIRSLKWIPGKSVDGQLALLAPNTCRGFDQGQLVDMVWGTANYSVKTDWRRVLGQYVR